MDSNYIQLQDGILTLPTGANFPISLEFKNVRKGNGTGGFSQALEIDGTPENSKLLGLYFDIDLENNKFDRNIKTECTVVQNGVEVFTGFIQLMKITRVNPLNSTNSKQFKYKINVFDEVSNFFISMGEKELTQLSFPELNHIFNRANIISSWDNTEGYTYPQYAVDWGIYTLKDFKPAIYELEYFKKIFSSNGYTYTFDQLTDLDIRFDKRIIPFNGKTGNDEIALQLQSNYTVIGQDEVINQLIDSSTITNYPIGFIPYLNFINSVSLANTTGLLGNRVSLDTVTQDVQNQWNAVNDTIVNEAGNGRNWTFITEYNYSVNVSAGVVGSFQSWQAVFNQSGAARCDVILTMVAQSTTDPTKFAYIDSQVIYSFEAGSSYSFASGWQSFASGNNQSNVEFGIFDNNEEIELTPIVLAKYYNSNGNQTPYQGGYGAVGNVSANNLLPQPPVVFKDTASVDVLRINFDVEITNFKIKAYPDINELVQGSIINMDAFIPNKIKQRDLISSIQKSYNLVFSPDPDNENNIIIKTRDKYYDDGEEWDWTNKIAEDQDNTIEFLSNDVNRRQILTYKEDDDKLNNAYQKEFNEVYGTTSITLDNEYTKDEDKKELIYAPTPSIWSSIHKVLPAINGISPDNKIRVLLNNGKKTTSAYQFYDDTTPTGTPLEVTDYLSTSMFDNDTTPNFSICFNAPKVLFHNAQSSQTSNYLYNLHHVNEMKTLNEGEVFTAYFKLNESDFQKLSRALNYKIYIKDNGWFFISKVEKYNAIKRTLTKVELITADDLTDIRVIKPLPDPDDTWVGDKLPKTSNDYNDIINDHFNEINYDSNVVKGSGNIQIQGKYNYVQGDNVRIFGDKNIVKSSDVDIVGKSNIVPHGFDGTRLINDGLTVEKVGTFIKGNTAYQDYSLASSGTITTTFEQVRFFGADLVNGTAELFDDVNSRILKMPINTLAEALFSVEIDSSSGSNPWVEIQLRAYNDTDTLLFSKRSVTTSIAKNVSNYELSVPLTFYFGSEDIEYWEIYWRADQSRTFTNPEITVKRY